MRSLRTPAPAGPSAEPLLPDEDAPRRGDEALPPRDQVAAFRPAILGIRGGTTAVSVALSSAAFVQRDWWAVGWCIVIVAYNAYRILRPVQYFDDTRSLGRVLTEVTLHVLAVVATGYWRSPFVFALITAVMVSGFARGYAFALRVGAASALAIGLPWLVRSGATGEDLRTAAQWTLELMLVALIAGYARRVTGEADRQHSLALDRLGRLSDANTLLFSLHRVAQSLPSSLDLEEVLDSTMHRLRDLFSYDSATLVLLDETDATWVVARWDGPRPARSYIEAELAAPLRRALATRQVVSEAALLRSGGPGISVEMTSGLYTVLPARSGTVGLLAVEHRDEDHFGPRDAELLTGFAEPVALAIDNARWFARLRTVGADEERTRIARDLHDRIGQSLAYMAFELDRIVKADERGEPVTEHLARLRNDVRGVIGEVSDTLYDLLTDVSDEQDMNTTIEGFLDRVAARSGLETSYRGQETGRLPLLQERELWRIAQEAVTNVERHARATRVAVTWRSDGERAALVVIDDGIGLAEGIDGRLDSYGILGMRERAASIGAMLEVHGTPGRGTTVRCEVGGG
ncbi:MAG: Signal transduction histidine kinase [Acidimicrobiales bacterium]|nr:Signal transduction histidine kinase [Acidimicrobiales bacterium]